MIKIDGTIMVDAWFFVAGFAIVYILVTVPYLLPWGARGALTGFLSWCHLIGAVSPWVGSFLYHVFMNLNYGEPVYRCLLKLDMLGIWICQSFGESTYSNTAYYSNHPQTTLRMYKIDGCTKIHILFFLFALRLSKLERDLKFSVGNNRNKEPSFGIKRNVYFNYNFSM